jgi:hypothetical protein
VLNMGFHNQHSSPDIIRIMKSRRMNWPGYVARMGEIMLRLFHTGLLLCLFFDPEDGGDMFLRNVG